MPCREFQGTLFYKDIISKREKKKFQLSLDRSQATIKETS